MTVEDSRPQSASKSAWNNATTTSIGRFYEKRHQLHGALDQYSKALSSNPDDTATYIDRSRVLLKMGSIDRAQEDTDSALNLLGDAQPNSSLLLYYVCLQRAEVLYADGEFELALMYFHRANKIKPAQQTCLEGIRKATEILECTICNPNIHLTITNNFMHPKEKQRHQANLLNRPPIRKELPSVEVPLTEFTNKEANRLLVEVAKDRRLLLDLHGDNQSSAGFTGLNKAKMEARQAILIAESQLKFLDKAECLQTSDGTTRENLICTTDMDRPTLIRIAEQELTYLQKLPPKEKSMEILYRSMKIINCLQSLENRNQLLDLRTPLLLAEAFRLVGQSYNEINSFEQSLENYKQAYQILSPLKEQSCLYRATYDIARSLMHTHRYSEATEIFLEMLSRSTSDDERAFAYQHLSFCSLNLNDYDQAKKYAYEALDSASLSHNELLRIEANILLGKIYFQLKDFQRAEEYLIYAQNLKDQLGDLHKMTYLDELLFDIKNQKAAIFQEKSSPFVWFGEEYHPTRTHDQWISSAMQDDRSGENRPDEQLHQQHFYHDRLLTPYYRLFDMCVDQQKKNRRQLESSKPTNATPKPSLPLLPTTTILT